MSDNDLNSQEPKIKWKENVPKAKKNKINEDEPIENDNANEDETSGKMKIDEDDDDQKVKIEEETSIDNNNEDENSTHDDHNSGQENDSPPPVEKPKITWKENVPKEKRNQTNEDGPIENEQINEDTTQNIQAREDDSDEKNQIDENNESDKINESENSNENNSTHFNDDSEKADNSIKQIEMLRSNSDAKWSSNVKRFEDNSYSENENHNDHSSENSEQLNQNDDTNQNYNPTYTRDADNEPNPYDMKEDENEKSESLKDEKDPENLSTRSFEKKDDDDDNLSVSSKSNDDQIPGAIPEDDMVPSDHEKSKKKGRSRRRKSDEDDEGESSCKQLFNKWKWAGLSSIITLVFIVISIAIAWGVKADIRLHIIEKTLEIVNKKGGYFIWACHCLGLVMLPFLFVALFGEEVKHYQIWSSPVMMCLNMIGGFLPIKGSFFPVIVELLIVMYLLFHVPFKPIYVPKTEDFWIGEISLMFLAFIYISSALSSSTLSYLLYGSYIRANGELVGGPSNPHYAIAYIDLLNEYGYYENQVRGGFLACYSLFTFLSVGIGFAMSMKNSIFMIIPFAVLATCTVIETHAIGILLFFQLFVHIIYITGMHFHATRKLATGYCCDCCLECCYATLTTIMIGDLIGFALVAFPILQLLIHHEVDTKFNWGGFIGGSFVIFIGIAFHCTYALNYNFWELLIACAGFIGGTLVFGLVCSGYAPFIRAFTYEVTYITWSFALCFWGYSSGYSPTLFKLYNGLISAAALVIVELYEGIGWLEIIFGIIQIVFDTVVITYVQKFKAKYVAWTVFSVSGIVVFGFIVGVAVIVATIIALCIIAYLCSCAGDCIGEMRAYDIAQGLEIGDTFECAGKTYIVTAG